MEDLRVFFGGFGFSLDDSSICLEDLGFVWRIRVLLGRCGFLFEGLGFLLGKKSAFLMAIYTRLLLYSSAIYPARLRYTGLAWFGRWSHVVT